MTLTTDIDNYLLYNISRNDNNEPERMYRLKMIGFIGNDLQGKGSEKK